MSDKTVAVQVTQNMMVTVYWWFDEVTWPAEACVRVITWPITARPIAVQLQYDQIKLLFSFMQTTPFCTIEADWVLLGFTSCPMIENLNVTSKESDGEKMTADVIKTLKTFKTLKIGEKLNQNQRYFINPRRGLFLMSVRFSHQRLRELKWVFIMVWEDAKLEVWVTPWGIG